MAHENKEPAKTGRSQITTRGDISQVALTLFFEKGFDNTTVDDIATAAGIGRRTFFRYFSSKNDLPWGEFDELLAQMHNHLKTIDQNLPLIEALRQAVLRFNDFPAQEIPYHRNRMWLLLNVPAVVAHSTLRFTSWREVVADFVALRRGEQPNDLTPQTIAWACMGLCLSAYEQWLAHPDADLQKLLGDAFDTAESVFSVEGQ